MFKLDRQGKCTTCLAKAKDAEIIQCEVCEFYFHGVCDSEDGKGQNRIAVQSHLKLFKQASTKKNFSWKCDKCLTISEQNQAATVKESISQFMIQFTEFKNQLPVQIKEIVKSEMENLTASQTDEFNKLAENISTQSEATSWNNSAKVQEIIQESRNIDKVQWPDLRESLIVKPDADGNPIDPAKVKKIIVDNGVAVDKVVVSSSGDTFINLPNPKSREKLQPLLQRDNDNDVFLLKKKLPQISILEVTDDLSKEDIKKGLLGLNESIGNLANNGQELSVVYTKAPPQGKEFHQVIVRVSPDIRKSIKAAGNKVHLSDKVCRVKDNFHVKRCNKCQDFGHYASKCKPGTAEVCGYCAASHKSSDCPIKDNPSHTHKCRNCEVAGLEHFTGHSTFSYGCPAYKIQQDKLKNAIAYDYNLN